MARARTHVVDRARLALERGETIGAHDVAHVVDVAYRVEGTGRDVVVTVALGFRDPARERRDQEPVGLAGTRVVERADAYGLEPRAEVRLQREVRRRDLGGRVRRIRAQRRVLVEWPLTHGAPVFFGAADHEHPAHARGARRVEDVQGSLDVDAEHRLRLVPRVADMRERGQVVHDLGLEPRERLVHGVAIDDVDCVDARAVDTRPPCRPRR